MEHSYTICDVTGGVVAVLDGYLPRCGDTIFVLATSQQYEVIEVLFALQKGQEKEKAEVRVYVRLKDRKSL